MRRLRRLAEVAKIGVASFFMGVLEEVTSPEERRSYDKMLRDVLRKTLPKTVEAISKIDHDRWRCHDCSEIDGGYMLTDELWEQATRGDPTIRRLCIACSTKRLDRPLSRDDFSGAPINQPLLWVLDETNR